MSSPNEIVKKAILDATGVPAEQLQRGLVDFAQRLGTPKLEPLRPVSSQPEVTLQALQAVSADRASKGQLANEGNHSDEVINLTVLFNGDLAEVEFYGRLL